MRSPTCAPALFAIAALLLAPAAGAATKAPSSPVASASGAAAAAPKPMDINSASKADLMTLPGIGEAEAKKIIAGRPFRSKARLVADNILPQAAYNALKGRIVAVQKTQPSAKSTKSKPGKDDKG
ncbi:MAG TPA: helix-hairpin-helix domain-containing protein [Rubrivivax sp.]|nr:helix-hairpin-helix domain-containing protein [Rubrivivax sp.]